jgi:hypothetical protein
LTLFHEPIERVLLRKARWEVEENLSRLASDWRDRVAAGINESSNRKVDHSPWGDESD